MYMRNSFMVSRLLVLLLFVTFSFSAKSQLQETFSHNGEFGFSVGLGHYFGDLDPNVALDHSKVAFGVFYSKQFGNYVSLKASVNYAALGYSDAYSKNLWQKQRNLSFDSDVWEFSLSGNFNFFKFYPEIAEFRFTPYISLGIGAMTFNPYASMSGNTYYLRSMKTEGQSSPYSNVALVAPLGMGVKYNVSDNVNVFAELIYRFTSTGYLDDVYGVYADPSAKNFPNDASLHLQDRSYQYGIFHKAGEQRGNSRNDSYATFQVGLSFNIEGYHCPMKPLLY